MGGALLRAMCAWVLALAAVVCSAYGAGDMFTSVAAMKSMAALLDPHQPNSLSNIIRHFARAESHKLRQLEEVADRLASRSVSGAVADLIGHPVDAFLLMRQLHSDWVRVQDITLKNKSETYAQNWTLGWPAGVPSDTDVTGAANAIMRLQDTYRLSTAQMADGKLGHGADSQMQMSSADCFFIGKTAEKRKNFYHALNWMEETLQRIDAERQSKRHIAASEADTLESLAYALFKQGNPEWAAFYTQKILEIEPQHRRAKTTAAWYQNYMADNKIKFDPDRLPRVMNVRPEVTNLPDTYEPLCRGESTLGNNGQSQLYCYYKRDRPFLKLAPFQVEILNQRPLAVMFKNVISDAEIEVIKTLAISKLKRANTGAGKSISVADYRITQTGWLYEGEHDAVDTINRRLELMTNLDMSTAEQLQAANYGLGGHYEPHYDVPIGKWVTRGGLTRLFMVAQFPQNDPDRPTWHNMGQRIATVLFYMSTPKLGGATAFTSLDLAVYPEKNNAVFWYNLHRNGEPDLRTRHAACPVLAGEKWAINKWIHERGQEFRRPCHTKASEFFDETFLG